MKFFPFILFLLLAGCGQTYEEGALSPPVTDFIILDDKGFMFDSCKYSISEQTVIIDDTGKALEFSDLQSGMKAEVQSSGPVLESYPCQTGAGRVKVLTDEQSLQEQEAVSAIAKYLSQEFDPIFLVKDTVEGSEFFQVEAEVLNSGFERVKLRYYYAEQSVEKLEE